MLHFQALLELKVTKFTPGKVCKSTEKSTNKTYLQTVRLCAITPLNSTNL
jgi:hypothetical protein